MSVRFSHLITTFYLGMAMMLLPGCSSSHKFPASYHRAQLRFGQGGGFTGVVTYYNLLEDGRLYQRGLRDSSFTYLMTWPGNFTRQVFHDYDVLKLDTVVFNQPGDLYYFIDFRAPHAPPHRIVWGRPGTHIDQNISTYYNLLFKSTKPRS